LAEPRAVNRVVMRTLHLALREHRCVEILYYTAGRDALTWRVVEPIAMEGDYLSAYCRWRREVRTFACWRIVTAVLLDEYYSPHLYLPPRRRPPFDDREMEWSYRASAPEAASPRPSEGTRVGGCILCILAAVAIYVLLKSCA